MITIRRQNASRVESLRLSIQMPSHTYTVRVFCERLEESQDAQTTTFNEDDSNGWAFKILELKHPQLGWNQIQREFDVTFDIYRHQTPAFPQLSPSRSSHGSNVSGCEEISPDVASPEDSILKKLNWRPKRHVTFRSRSLLKLAILKSRSDLYVPDFIGESTIGRSEFDLWGLIRTKAGANA